MEPLEDLIKALERFAWVDYTPLVHFGHWHPDNPTRSIELRCTVKPDSAAERGVSDDEIRSRLLFLAEQVIKTTELQGWKPLRAPTVELTGREVGRLGATYIQHSCEVRLEVYAVPVAAR